MARTCTVCRSDDAEAINAAIVSGSSQRQVAEAFRVGPASVQRHATTHLPARLKAAAVRADVAGYDVLITRMMALVGEGKQVLEVAKHTAGDQRLVLAAIKELRETLTSLAKFSHIEMSDSDVEVLVKALGRMLPRFPDAALALSEELARLGQSEAAEVIASAAPRTEVIDRLAPG